MIITYKEMKENLSFNLSDYPNLDEYVRTVLTEAEKIEKPQKPEILDEVEKFPNILASKMGIFPERERGVYIIPREEILSDEDTAHIGSLLPEGIEWFLQQNTRTGGGNWEDYIESNMEMVDHKNHVYDYDDSFDSTYHYFLFTIDEQDLVTNYFNVIKPSADKEQIDYYRQNQCWDIAYWILHKKEGTPWVNHLVKILKQSKGVLGEKAVDLEDFSGLEIFEDKNIKELVDIVNKVHSPENKKAISDIEALLQKANDVAKNKATTFDFNEDIKALSDKADELSKLALRSRFMTFSPVYLPAIVEESRIVSALNHALEDISNSDFEWKEVAIKELNSKRETGIDFLSYKIRDVRKKFDSLLSNLKKEESTVDNASLKFEDALKSIEAMLAQQ